MNAQLYTHIVQGNADKLFRYVLKQGVRTEEARDIVQNCFEALWKSTVVEQDHAAKYLFAAAHNQCADYWRKDKRVSYREQLPEQQSSTLKQGNHLQAWLHKALLNLSEQERSLVLLKDYEGYSYEEIAEICQLSSTQVKVYLHRARTKLKTHIGNLKQVI
jgi:RNA polymerase sigma factor (sigma-70 family)